MKLLVISDSHGRPDRIRAALGAQISQPDALLFLGDGYADIMRCGVEGPALFCVSGNCDYFTVFDKTPPPRERLLSLGGYNLLMMHGDRYAVGAGNEKAAAYAAEKGADLLLYGHTHVRCEEYIPAGTRLAGRTTEKPLRIFNPGSLGSPRGGEPSFGLIELRESGIICGWGEL